MDSKDPIIVTRYREENSTFLLPTNEDLMLCNPAASQMFSHICDVPVSSNTNC